jgi:hypothetical protein
MTLDMLNARVEDVHSGMGQNPTVRQPGAARLFSCPQLR